MKKLIIALGAAALLAGPLAAPAPAASESPTASCQGELRSNATGEKGRGNVSAHELQGLKGDCGGQTE